MRVNYLYLRTKRPWQHEPDALSELGETFPYAYWTTDIAPSEPIVSVLGFGRNRSTWGDGVVLRFHTDHSPEAVTGHIPSDHFDAWVVINDDREHCESPTSMSVGRFFRQRTGTSFAQLYLHLADADQERIQYLVET